MRSRSNARFRFALLAPLVGALLALVAVSAPAAQGAVGVERFVAVNCSAGHETCGEEGAPPFTLPKKEVSEAEAKAEGYTQAGGRVPFGITDFKVTTVGDYAKGEAQPTGVVTHVRTDVATGLATSPVAVPECKVEEFGVEVAPGTFTGPACSGETIIGINKVVVALYTETGTFVTDVPIEGKVYNLVPPDGRSSDFGVALPLPEFITKSKTQLYAHTLIEGNVEWGKEAKGTGAGDYHDYFEINVSPELPLIRSRLVLIGTSGRGDFITNATSCPGDNTTRLSLEGVEGAKQETPFRAPGSFTTPVGLSGCGSLLFEPKFELESGSKLSDQPNEITTAVSLPNNPTASAQSQVKTGTITLPEGMTLDPSAAAGLAACTPAQARIHSETFGSECPAASELGTVNLEVPTLPAGSLTGSMYLGGPESGPITGPPYIVYVVANSKKYGVSVRIKGEVEPNLATGQLTTIFKENPEQPFTNLSLHFNRGVLTAIANPLVCGTPTGTASFVPVAGTPTVSEPFGVSVTGCASPLPFALTQSTANQNANAGGNTSFTFNLSRPEGQQYLSQVKTTLPPGLVALLPTVTPCGEEQANAGTCPASSQVGAAAALAGSGPTPFLFTGGTVYLTGPYHGAPYGLSIVVPAVAGPFSLGNVVTRATINVDPITARVTVTSVLPTIHAGIPLRLRGITVAINKQGYLINPTNCSAFLTESTLTSTFGTTQTGLNSPFQVNNCGALAFKPSFKAKTSAKTSKANGASLETTLNIGSGQTNFKSVMVQLPKQLPSRLTTLQKACPESVFAANPYKCPSGSFVGGARANTPTLPGKLQGPAILVSHAGLAFPDLDLVMEANGVKVILVGNTKISKGITTTTFASTPDVPVSSITVNLPIGGHSALTANGNLCINPLTMPTTLIGQNGFKVTQKTKITIASCGVRIAGKKIVGNTAYITVQTYSAGRISGSGSNLKTVYRKLSKAQKTATLKVPLSNAGLRRGKPLKVKLRVGFVPKTKSIGNSASTTTVVFG